MREAVTLASRPRGQGVHTSPANPTPARSRSTSWLDCCGRCRDQRPRRARGPRAECPGPDPRRQPGGSAAAGRPARNRRPRRRAARHHPRCPAAPVGGLVEQPPPWPGPHRTVYVIEDVHWIDEVSEAMLAEFVTVVPQSRSLVLITYRPEYRGALSRTPAPDHSLAPLNAPRPRRWPPSCWALTRRCARSRPDRRTGRREPVLRRGDGA